MPVYIALLGAYAADNEIRRWIGTPEPAHCQRIANHRPLDLENVFPAVSCQPDGVAGNKIIVM